MILTKWQYELLNRHHASKHIFRDARGICVKSPKLLLANDAPHRVIAQT